MSGQVIMLLCFIASPVLKAYRCLPPDRTHHRAFFHRSELKSTLS